MVPYVVGALINVLLNLVDVSMLRECEADDIAGMGDAGGVDVVSTGYEYVGGTRDSGIVSSAAYVLVISVVRVWLRAVWELRG